MGLRLAFGPPELRYQDSTGLVVSAGCTGASTLSEGKIYRPECSAQFALYSENRKPISR